jgi:tRNA nucleotidyltransferase (CCA-adding enzyme)
VDRPEPSELFLRALELPAVAGVVEKLAGEPGVRIALVGGAVRDLILGRAVTDVDLAVEGPVEPVVGRLGGPARSHVRFGTATVEVSGSRVDLARTRRESYPQPGALPEVAPGTLRQDLLRRDFTVNALALPVTGAGTGELVAVDGAQDDLEHGRLRVLHPASFIDDPTRLFRLVRYRARLGFEIEPETSELARRAVAGGAVATLTGPRIGHELEMIDGEEDPVAAWSGLRELGLDEAVEPGFGMRDPALTRRALSLLPSDGRRDPILLAVALAGVAPDSRPALLDRLGVASRTRDDALFLADRAVEVSGLLNRAGSPALLAAVIGDRAAVELAALAGAMGAEAPARNWLEHLRHLRLQIGGDDLLAAGISPGPAIGAGLTAAREALLEGRADSPGEQLSEALRAARAAE